MRMRVRVDYERSGHIFNLRHAVRMSVAVRSATKTRKSVLVNVPGCAQAFPGTGEFSDPVCQSIALL